MAVALEQFVKQLTDSGVIAPGKLENFVPPKAHPKDAQELAKQLVQSKHLTKFQAQEIYTGRAKSLILGNYTILDKIGAGGMGQVFKAEHRRMHRVVAIKMLPKNVTKNALAIARFQREVDAAAKLEHPNIVTAHDADDSDGVHFLVMQFVEGSDLSVLVKKHGPLSVDKAVNYILQAARGLEYAHKLGVVHRDIKPANLLLNSEGTVKILDMGLARIDGGNDAGAQAQAELTGTGAVMGTVDYMAPEQALSTKHADARADIYSLGCSLYYLLTGHAAYDGETLMAKLMAHRDSPIPCLGASAPEQIQAVFEKMVAKSVDDRYQTMSEVVAALEQFNAGQQASLSIQPPVGSGSSSDLLTFLKNVPLNTIHKPEPANKATAATAGKSNRKLLLGAIGAGLLSVAILAAVIISMRAKDPATLEPPGNNRAIANAGQGSARWDNPAFKQWMNDVAAMPAEKQVDAVAKKLVELNPAFDGQVTPKIENGVVTELIVATDDVADISPVRALKRLRVLRCGGHWPDKGKLSALSPLSGMSLTDFVCDCTQVSDLSPLTGMHLKYLAFGNTQVTDLSPLKGMPLEALLFWGTRVSELSPLKGMPLTELGMSGTPVTDLSPLRGMPLTNLGCQVTNVSDLMPLKDLNLISLCFTPQHITQGMNIIRQMKSLNRLGPVWDHLLPPDEFWKKYDASEFGHLNTAVNDPAFQGWLKEVAALPAAELVEAVVKKLQELNPGFDGAKTAKIDGGVVTELSFVADNVADISPVRALSGLKRLTFHGSSWVVKGKVADLSPLKGLKLVYLACNDTQVTDLSAISGMPLSQLNCSGTSVSDLSALAGLPLTSVTFDRTQIADLSPLKGLLLTRLSFFSTPISDLSPLHGMPLKSLSVGDTHVSDLAPLRGMKLESLFCDRGAVSDLSAIQEMPLKSLQCEHARISDLSSLRGMNLTKLSFTPASITRGIDAIRQMKSLKSIGDDHRDEFQYDPKEFWKKYDAGDFGKPITTFNDPGFQQWVKGVAALPAAKQVEAVDQKLRELNPRFDGQEKHKIEHGAVTEFQFTSPDVNDLSPIRAFTELTSLRVYGGERGGNIADLSPLQGMHLTTLSCIGMKIVDLSPIEALPLKDIDVGYNLFLFDLSPLQGMPLTSVRCSHTPIFDLSPLKQSKLNRLYCNDTKVADLAPLADMPLADLSIRNTGVSDLSPLKGLRLTALNFTPKSIAKGLDAIRQMNSLQNIGSESRPENMFPAKEFWKKYEAGDFNN